LIKVYKALCSVTGFKTEIDDLLIRIGVSLIFGGEKKYMRSFRALKIKPFKA